MDRMFPETGRDWDALEHEMAEASRDDLPWRTGRTHKPGFPKWLLAIANNGISPISLTLALHAAVRVTPPPKPVQIGSNSCPHSVSMSASL